MRVYHLYSLISNCNMMISGVNYGEKAQCSLQKVETKAREEKDLTKLILL